MQTRCNKLFSEEIEDNILDFDELAAQSASDAQKSAQENTAANFRVREEVKAPRQAEWLPLLLAPDYLDGSMGGDVGFDPLGLASKPGAILWMRDAEVKHARLAMLAAAGWPLSELWHKEIASFLNLPSILAEEGKAPSILNGGLDNSWIYGAFIGSIVLGGILEAIAIKNGAFTPFDSDRNNSDYKPGAYGFDPLGLYTIRSSFILDRVSENLTREQKITRARLDMETAEVKNGRLAMLAITGMALQELISGMAVVDQTPFFFGDPIR